MEYVCNSEMESERERWADVEWEIKRNSPTRTLQGFPRSSQWDGLSSPKDFFFFNGVKMTFRWILFHPPTTPKTNMWAKHSKKALAKAEVQRARCHSMKPLLRVTMARVKVGGHVAVRSLIKYLCDVHKMGVCVCVFGILTLYPKATESFLC